MSNFLDKLSILEEKISLIGISLKNRKHPLIQRLNLARSRYVSGDKTLGCVNACYIQSLLEDLALIRKSKNDLFQKFKKLLRQTNLSFDSYFGIRFEIRIAAFLAKNNIDFIKSERPDFIVQNQIFDFGIECTSVHLYLEIEDPSKEVFSKVELAINNKKNGIYSIPETILFIDVTNLIYQEGRNPSFSILADIDKAKPLLIKIINKTQFSSLLYFCQSWVPLEQNQLCEAVTLHNLCWRVDKGNIQGSLKEFLDRFFPENDIWIEANTGKIV